MYRFTIKAIRPVIRTMPAAIPPPVQTRAVRRAVCASRSACEIELITRELATDIARSGAAEHYSSTDIALLADLVVSFVVTMADRLVDDPGAEAQTLDQARTQLRMLLVGALNWRSREPGGTA